MRNLWLALILVASLSTFVTTSHARGKGGQDAGGGNVFEIEFKATGSLLSKQIHDAQISDSQLGYSLAHFDVATRDVQVIATNEKISLNGNSKSAINSSNQRIIVFNGQIWALLNLDQKRMLVLHEYLRFTNADDSEYKFTLRTLELLKSPVAHAPEREKTYKIVSADLNRWAAHYEYAFTLEDGGSGKLHCVAWSRNPGSLEYTEMTLNLPVPQQSGRFKKVLLDQSVPNKSCEYENLLSLATPNDPVYLVIKNDGTFSFIK